MLRDASQRARLWQDLRSRCAALLLSMRARKPRRDSYHLPPKRAAVAARVRRLIGDARMIGAVRQPRDGLPAAEEEVRLPGIADWPAAGLLGELEQGAALAER